MIPLGNSQWVSDSLPRSQPTSQRRSASFQKAGLGAWVPRQDRDQVKNSRSLFPRPRHKNNDRPRLILWRQEAPPRRPWTAQDGGETRRSPFQCFSHSSYSFPEYSPIKTREISTFYFIDSDIEIVYKTTTKNNVLKMSSTLSAISWLGPKQIQMVKIQLFSACWDGVMEKRWDGGPSNSFGPFRGAPGLYFALCPFIDYTGASDAGLAASRPLTSRSPRWCAYLGFCSKSAPETAT